MTDPTWPFETDDAELLAVYDEMRIIARRRVRATGSPSFEATELVNEAYVRMRERGVVAPDRARLFRLAARAMRDILVERARRKASRKRGGDWAKVSWESAALVAVDHPDELLLLDAALEKLSAEDEKAAEVVALKFFAGLSGDETASTLGVSPATVDRRWAFARAWLHRQLTGDESTEGD